MDGVAGLLVRPLGRAHRGKVLADFFMEGAVSVMPRFACIDFIGDGVDNSRAESVIAPAFIEAGLILPIKGKEISPILNMFVMGGAVAPLVSGDSESVSGHIMERICGNVWGVKWFLRCEDRRRPSGAR